MPTAASLFADAADAYVRAAVAQPLSSSLACGALRTQHAWLDAAEAAPADPVDAERAGAWLARARRLNASVDRRGGRPLRAAERCRLAAADLAVQHAARLARLMDRARASPPPPPPPPPPRKT